ncbi:hypothetical protein ABE545_16675 [Sphingobacterium faecium]|uniref:hypothetical protein n=1 Tax=Sphingobacterium faecium TaxID=34087 RepID=UPI0032079B97
MKNRSEAIYQTLLSMHRLLEGRMARTGPSEGDCMTVSAAEVVQTRSYSEEELMTIREAYLELKISRNTLDGLRRQKKLTSVFNKRNVRLIRTEVEAAKRWYSLVKGKL